MTWTFFLFPRTLRSCAPTQHFDLVPGFGGFLLSAPVFLLVLAGILPHLSTALVPVAFFVVLLGMILCIVHERGR